MFNDFPEQQAICAFFLDFVLLPRHPDTTQGHLEHLSPLYAKTSAGSPLSLATSSVALMMSGNSPARRSDQQLGRTIFGKALKKTSAAIRNPAESMKDETLMAVLLLGLFEVCSTPPGHARNSCRREFLALTKPCSLLLGPCNACFSLGNVPGKEAGVWEVVA